MYQYICLGSGTTHIMSYAMVAIITDPDHAGIIKKMRDELDANLGQEPMRLSEKHKIPYCEAVSIFLINSMPYQSFTCFNIVIWAKEYVSLLIGLLC